jgi:hypothetical protein
MNSEHASQDMDGRDDLSAGDEWPEHYRGFTLQISPDRTVWWQLYNGTERLELSEFPSEVIDSLLEVKHLGGRVHITECGDVLTRVEEDSGDSYQNVYIGSVDLSGDLVPDEGEEYGIPIQPSGLSEGDLWPSVYDGSRYSFAGDRVWWQSGSDHRRHKVEGEFAPSIIRKLKQYKPSGGSFRITPWGDVITLVPSHPAPGTVREQFGELPRVVQNIIKLRKNRDVEMLPVYIGTIEDRDISVKEPRSLTDSLSEEEQEDLASWATGLGTTSRTSNDSHTASTSEDTDQNTSESGTSDGNENTEPPEFTDDPLEWMKQDTKGVSDE